MAQIRSGNPAKVIAALVAQPLVLAVRVAEGAGISRMTAERLLARMQEMGLDPGSHRQQGLQALEGDGVGAYSTSRMGSDS